MNTTSLTKMQRELVAVTEESDRLAAELAQWKEAAQVAVFTVAVLTEELANLRNNKPVAWRYQDANGNYRYRSYVPGFDVEYKILKPVALYAAPVPAPAVPAPSVPYGMMLVKAQDANNYCRILTLLGMEEEGDPVGAVSAMLQSTQAVPEEWREVMVGLVAIAEKKGKKHGSPNHCHQRPGVWDDDNGPALSGKPCAECAMYDRARALLPATTERVTLVEPGGCAPAVFIPDDDTRRNDAAFAAIKPGSAAGIMSPMNACMHRDTCRAMLQSVPAPSVPEEWKAQILAVFPLLDDTGLCEEEHHCEWAMQQDRKRLHALLQSTAQQVAPSVPEEWKRAVSDFLESHDAALHELFKYLPANTQSVIVSNYQADAVRKANVLRALLQSADRSGVNEDGGVR